MGGLASIKMGIKVQLTITNIFIKTKNKNITEQTQLHFSKDWNNMNLIRLRVKELPRWIYSNTEKNENFIEITKDNLSETI